MLLLTCCLNLVPHCCRKKNFTTIFFGTIKIFYTYNYLIVILRMNRLNKAIDPKKNPRTKKKHKQQITNSIRKRTPKIKENLLFYGFDCIRKKFLFVTWEHSYAVQKLVPDFDIINQTSADDNYIGERTHCILLRYRMLLLQWDIYSLLNMILFKLRIHSEGTNGMHILVRCHHKNTSSWNEL